MAKALVVDDSKVIRLILGKTLEGLGYQVFQASNGQEALETLAKEAIDLRLVLVDWNMPVMNGLEFIRQVRADPDYAGITLMMVTTETHLDQVSAALEAGANEYVMKPFTADIIAGKLRLLGCLQ
jgi:two-component system, chemotaxis family, chemotaxis protein CheY